MMVRFSSLNSSPEKSNPKKKFVLLVTDKGMQTSEGHRGNLSFVTQNQPAAVLNRPKEIPPLRYIGRGKPVRADEVTTPQYMPSPTR